METNQLLLSSLFLLTVVATWIILYKALKGAKFMWFVALIWIPAQLLVGIKGFYLDTRTMPPHFLLTIGPPLLLIAFITIFKHKYLLENTSLKHLTLLHMVRIAVELVLLGLFLTGEVPKLMTFEGSNPDILSGITAPLVWWGYRKGILGNKALLLWNFACLGLLLNIVIRAILSAPLPFQQFAFDQPNVALLKAPFVLLPAFVVPAVMFAHVAAILKLVDGNVTSVRDLR
ncbi:hypothetical protein LZD49_01995 [Dyadobacter sp. CY261]|uniref:hypothetical protein n=1 Tax=Dyadobacter sp. CY261 TaxID=2907203 RepID=UPI001F25A0CE|nr:hypothetical protein [Dyadobacter sp. CY261]MCF0069225.1 hypothetical protein [Dyadobacter sp. CY261]